MTFSACQLLEVYAIIVSRMTSSECQKQYCFCSRKEEIKMFCSSCGSQLEEGTLFCSECGTKVVEESEKVRNDEKVLQEEIVDLTGMVEENAPREKRHVGTVIASVLLVLVWSAIGVLADFVCKKLGYPSRSTTMLASSLFSVPIGVIGIPLVLILRKVAKLTRKITKTESVLFYTFGFLLPALSLVAGFGNSFFSLRLGAIMVKIMFGIFALLFLILCFIYSKQNGKEGMFSILTGAAIGFFIAPILTWIVGTIFAMLELFLVIMVVGIFLFVFLGGGVIIVRVRK